MRHAIEVDGREMNTLLARMSQETGISVAPVLVEDYAKEMRRVRGGLVSQMDEARMDGGKDAMIKAANRFYSKTYVLTRNFFLWSLMNYLPMGTTLHMKIEDAAKSIRVLITDENGPNGGLGWVKLV